LYHRSPEQLRLAYGKLNPESRYFEARGTRVGAEQPITIRGEDEPVQSMVIKKVLVAEVYIRCPIHDDEGDPREYELMLILDVDNHDIIFADYLGNHMSKRPFAVIPGVEKVPDRWYGIGVFSKMAHPETYADAQLNRINQKDSRAASVTIRHKNAVTQWKNGEPVEFGTNKVYDFDPGWDPERDPIKRYNLLEHSELGMELMEKMRQAGDLEFGIQTNAAASAMGMNRSETATGVNDIARDSNVIGADQEFDIARGIEEVLAQAVEMELDAMDEQVLAFSADGSEIATLNRSEIRSLERQVKLLLTKSRSSEMASLNQAARAAWLQYMRLSPVEQYYGRPFFIDELKGYQVNDADERLPEVSKEDMQAWVKAQAQKQEPPKPTSENLAIRYSDLAPSEKAQALLRAGIQPAPPQEVAISDAQKLATKVTEKQAGAHHDIPNESATPATGKPGGSAEAI
jgi:hypothetical protein